MVVDFPDPVGPVIRIRPCSRAPHRLRSHSGAPSAFNVLLHGWLNFYHARIGRKWNRGCGRVIARSCDMNQLEHARQLAKLMCRWLSNKKKAARRSKYEQ